MTSSSDMTGILEDLAAGRIDAAEAARRIDALKTPEAETDAPREPSNEELAAASADAASADGIGEPVADAWSSATDRPQSATHTTESFKAPEEEPEAQSVRVKPADTKGVERISVRAVGRRVRIVGESSIATVSADGPHVLRRNGSTLEISSDGEIGSSIDGFQLLRGAPRSLEDFRALGLGKELFLRVNPDIVVDVEVTAGSLNTERVPNLGKVRVTAGGAKLLDVEQVADALVQAGQATIKGTITKGRSRVRAESGSLSIHLGDDSNVTIKGEAQLGKVSWSGGHTGAGDEVVMGNGNARLDVEVVMGHAQVRVGSAPAESQE